MKELRSSSMHQRQTLLDRSASRVSSIHAKVKRKFSQRSNPRPSLENRAPPDQPKQAQPLQSPPAFPPSSSHPPPSSYNTKAAPPSLYSSGASSSTESPHPPSRSLFRRQSRPVSLLPRMARTATRTLHSGDTTDDEIIRPSPPRPLPSFYNLNRPSEPPLEVGAEVEETPSQRKPKRRRRHSVRRSINKVSDMFLGPLLGHRRSNETHDPDLVPEPPQIARLSFASEASTGTLGRYLAMRQVNEMFESNFTVEMSIFAYECNGSWIREHEQKYQESYMCLDPVCEAHHGRMSFKTFQRRKAEERVWFG